MITLQLYRFSELSIVTQLKVAMQAWYSALEEAIKTKIEDELNTAGVIVRLECINQVYYVDVEYLSLLGWEEWTFKGEQFAGRASIRFVPTVDTPSSYLADRIQGIIQEVDDFPHTEYDRIINSWYTKDGTLVLTKIEDISEIEEIELV